MASLIDVANALATADPTRPSQPYLRRAVSTAYFAMFHALARDCADVFIGTGAVRRHPDWTQVFRALDHGPTKKACEQAANLGFSADILRFADAFLALQQERHRADYDPSSQFAREDVLNWIKEADGAIRRLANAPRPDRRAFAVLVCFKRR